MLFKFNLVIHTRESTKKQIEEQCKTIYKGKLEVMNIISERMGKDYRKFELVEDQGELLRDLNTYFPKLMNYLWEQPKVVSSIIQNCEPTDLKQYIAPLFANNFYENILSQKYIEDNLMYVLTLLLENEINGLNNINQNTDFLNQTPCGYLLEELKRKNDIQAFFKSIIVNAVETLEVNYSSSDINFKISKMTEEYKKKHVKVNNIMKKMDENYLKYQNENSATSESISAYDWSNNYRIKKLQTEQEIFNQKYIPFLNKESLQKLIDENKNNKNLYEFLYSKLNDCSINKDFYSNKKFMDNLYKNEYAHTLLFQYQFYFTIVINFIDTIIEKILNNFHLLPYSVKCLCKIISMLIVKKFPSISETEKNTFIAKFFFGKLLIPILKNPGIESFINNFIISRNTIKNLAAICDIINRLSSGQFYNSDESESDYTPFNWYFIEKMDQLFNIYKHITKVKLPTFIEKLVNKQLPSDYEYDYFKENPDEVINHRSICFNIEQVNALLNVMNKYKDKIFVNPKSNGLKKTVEKLVSANNQQLINNILSMEKREKKTQMSIHTKKDKKREKDDKDSEAEKTKLHYFLITSLLTNDYYKKLFDIEQQTRSFSLPELKQILNEEDDMKNNIIKVKNFFCSLLYNYNKFVKTDFDEGSTENTEKILNELNIFMKSSNFVIDGSIPSEWYVKSLLEYLQKIPEKLTNNDCEKLYNEIENDINKSIKELDFEALSVIFGKLQFVKRGTIYYEDSKKLLNDIKVNEETNLIIENDLIITDIKFSLDEEGEEDIFEISPSSFKVKDRGNIEKMKDYERSKKVKICFTIEDFTKKFPDLVKYQELQDADIFEIQKDFNFSTKINAYLNQIKICLEKKGIIGLDLINEKIYDYIMSKIYDKIYPNEPFGLDNKIFQQSIRLSWTEAKHFIKRKKKLVFGSFLSDVIEKFKLIDSEKSPRKKIMNMNEIFNAIGFLLKFNGAGLDAGVDDQLPILNYAFVKAQPLRMFSNAKYMELYIGEKKNKIEGSQLTQLLSICNFISTIKASNLIDVNDTEFFEKCNEATKGTGSDIP